MREQYSAPRLQRANKHAAANAKDPVLNEAHHVLDREQEVVLHHGGGHVEVGDVKVAPRQHDQLVRSDLVELEIEPEDKADEEKDSDESDVGRPGQDETVEYDKAEDGNRVKTRRAVMIP